MSACPSVENSHRFMLSDAIQHAAHDYPRECCGLIYRSGRVRRCKNIASRPDCFELAADDVLALFESLQSADPVRAIYHSHCDAPATFSEADRAGALRLGYPILADLTWCVIESRGGKSVALVSYRWHSDRFQCLGRQPLGPADDLAPTPADALAG